MAIIRGNTITGVNIGDSRVTIGKLDPKTGKIVAEEFTHDNKVSARAPAPTHTYTHSHTPRSPTTRQKRLASSGPAAGSSPSSTTTGSTAR